MWIGGTGARIIIKLPHEAQADERSKPITLTINDADQVATSDTLIHSEYSFFKEMLSKLHPKKFFGELSLLGYLLSLGLVQIFLAIILYLKRAEIIQLSLEFARSLDERKMGLLFDAVFHLYLVFGFLLVTIGIIILTKRSFKEGRKTLKSTEESNKGR